MSTALAADRSRVCTFTFLNGRQCKIPLAPNHPYLCTFHARKESQAQATERLGRDIAFDLSGRYISFCDLSSALAHTITAVAQRHIPTRTAATIAYLTQNLVQSVAGAQKEYIDTFGDQVWRDTVAANFNAPRPGEKPADDHATQSTNPDDTLDHDPDEDSTDNQLTDDPVNDDPETDTDADHAAADDSDAADSYPENSAPDAHEDDPETDDASADDTLDDHPSPPQVEALLNRLRLDLETR